jgi:hypothetical protein
MAMIRALRAEYFSDSEWQWRQHYAPKAGTESKGMLITK